MAYVTFEQVFCFLTGAFLGFLVMYDIQESKRKREAQERRNRRNHFKREI